MIDNGTISAGEPEPTDPITEHEMAAISEDRLDDLGEMLAKRRDEWVDARRASGVEKRWQDDLDQYHGRDESTRKTASMMESVEQGYPVTNRDAKPQRSTLYVNITRPKTNAVEARLANMVFPSDDRNWGVKPSPKPELVKAAKAEMAKKAQEEQVQAMQAAQAAQMQQPQGAPQGMPQPMAAPIQQPVIGVQPASATEQLEEAEKRCAAMQDEISDQLLECDYNAEGRKMLHDVCVLGTGIMKGPIVVNRARKAWQPMKDSNDPSVFVLEIVNETKPASEAVSPWHVFTDPSCGNNPHNGRGIYEFKNLTGKQLRELADQPGYLKHKISEVLEAGSDGLSYHAERDVQTRAEAGKKDIDKDLYQVWEYWGEFAPEDLEAAGVDVPEGSTDAISGCVIFVNKTVIKGFLNPIETGDLPYDFMQCELVDDSVWGYGIPFLIRPTQRALNAAWRQLMDNSGLSVGPQIFIKSKGVTPADKRWEISGRKVWLVDDEVNPRDAFASMEIANHGQEIQQIIDLSMRFAEEEASLPKLMQGEKGNAPDTVGGMTLLMNSSNVVLGRLVKQFDDGITRPHIRRYYDWNMAYSDKAEIKGDFQVDARGSSALLVRDMQAQALLQLGQFQSSGIIAPFVNWEEWFKMILKQSHIDPSEIMKSDEEIAKMQQQPPQATPEQIRANAQLQVAQMRAEATKEVADAKVQGELAYAEKMAQIELQNAQARAQERHDEMQLKLLEYAMQQKLSLQEVQAQLADRAMQERTKRELGAAEVQLAASEGDKNRLLDHHQHATSLIRDTMTTPVTP